MADRTLRILLGGIPLGCDNIGDEAILAGVVKMIKSSLPGVSITVATADPSTADLLDVAVAPPYGFVDLPLSSPTVREAFSRLASSHDVYVWCGATGLSDYPNVALGLLDLAQRAGVPTFVWGVGMDNELNPAFFRVSGRKRAVLSALGLLRWYERRLEGKIARKAREILPRCKGVWLRDPQSAARLAALGFDGAKVAADSAILLPADMAAEPPSRGKRLGLCISTQRQVSDLAGVRRLVDAVRSAGIDVLGIPMNPKTDRRLLCELGVDCIEGTTPDAVMAAARGCDAVLSSRLHLLILAANAGTQGFGIARGTKLANWLSNFGSAVEGDVANCDWDATARRMIAAVSSPGDWERRRAAAYEALAARLETARREFIGMLG